MGHRNMISSGQMFDIEMDEQGQGHHPEPCIFLGNIADITHPNVHPILSASGRTGSVDLHHLPEHQDDSIFHGAQYNGLQHHHPFANLDLGAAAAAASNFYNPYMVPSSGTIISPVPPNHASLDQLPSSSNQGIIGHGVDDYERNSYFMDGFRGSGKRKNAEGIPGNYHHINASESSSSSSLGAPLNTVLHQWGQQFESGANVLDAEAFSMPECEGNGILSITEGGPRRSVRSRSNAIDLMGSALAHNNNHLVQGNYMGQSSQPTNSAWVEHQFGTNGGDGSTSAWNYGPTISYLHGRSVTGGSLEIGGLGGQGYQEATNNRNFPVLLHSSSHPHHHHQRHHHLPHYHYPSPMQGMQSHSYTYHPQVPTPYSHPTSSNALHHGTLNPSTESLGAGTRHPRPFPSSGLRIYHPRRRGAPHAALEGNNRPRLRILSTDEVAILEFPGFYEVGNFVDQHRDMRLDIDDMSYEELLALEERIGNVITGLSEETITKCLRTRTHVSCTSYFNLNQSASIDEETETCIICQVEFENQEKIGTLDCGHEYHADCIKKWLLVKNVCPICKKSALAAENNGR